jgi:acyl-CoA synthetase (AMP-forming)/AMP-acid ligase II
MLLIRRVNLEWYSARRLGLNLLAIAAYLSACMSTVSGGSGGVAARSCVSAEDIIAYTRERLAAYKYPREIRFMTELPKEPSGKILKSALRGG